MERVGECWSQQRMSTVGKGSTSTWRSIIWTTWWPSCGTRSPPSTMWWRRTSLSSTAHPRSSAPSSSTTRSPSSSSSPPSSSTCRRRSCTSARRPAMSTPPSPSSASAKSASSTLPKSDGPRLVDVSRRPKMSRVLSLSGRRWWERAWRRCWSSDERWSVGVASSGGWRRPTRCSITPSPKSTNAPLAPSLLATPGRSLPSKEVRNAAITKKSKFRFEGILQWRKAWGTKLILLGKERWEWESSGMERGGGNSSNLLKWLPLKEQIQKLECGAVPRSMLVVLEDDLVDCCQAGMHVFVFMCERE